MTNVYQAIMSAYEHISWIIDRTSDYSINDINIGNNINVSFDEHVFPDILDDFDLNISPTTLDFDLEIVIDNDLNINKTEIECCVCMENINDICLLSCQHIFCIYCIKKTFRNKQDCPLCRKNINKVFVSSQENREKLMKTHHP